MNLNSELLLTEIENDDFIRLTLAETGDYLKSNFKMIKNRSIGSKNLVKLLRQLGVFRQDKPIPIIPYRNNGYFEVIEKHYRDYAPRYQTIILGKGLAKIIRYLLKEGFIAPKIEAKK